MSLLIWKFKKFLQNFLKITFVGHQKFPLLLILKRGRRHRVRTVRLTGRPSGGGRPGRQQTPEQRTAGTWNYRNQLKLIKKKAKTILSFWGILWWLADFEVVLKESIIEPFLSTIIVVSESNGVLLSTQSANTHL